MYCIVTDSHVIGSKSCDNSCEEYAANHNQIQPSYLHQQETKLMHTRTVMMFVLYDTIYLTSKIVIINVNSLSYTFPLTVGFMY